MREINWSFSVELPELPKIYLSVECKPRPCVCFPKRKKCSECEFYEKKKKVKKPKEKK